jgi:hypothetical protein
VLAGIGCVAAVWWIVRAIASERAALFAAGALAVAPFAVSYSDYARGFILADLGLLIALGAAIRRNWWLYVLGAAVALYAEYDSALFLVALSFVAGWRALLPIAVLIPWIPFIGSSDTKVAPVYPNPSPGSFRDIVVRLTFGEHGTAHAVGLRWIQFVVVAAVVVWAFRQTPRIIWMTAAGTLVLHAVVHWIGPDVFAPRYLTELIPLGAIAVGIAVAQFEPRRLQVAAAVAIAALGVAVVVKRAQGNDEPDYKGVARIVDSAAHHRIVLTNSAVVAYYMRDVHPRLDRPFGLGHGLQSDCLMDCGGLYLIVDDTRVANGARIGRGHAHQFGALYVRATP